MQLQQLQASAKTSWQNNKPFVLFVCSLLLLLSLLKIIFYNYNYDLVFQNGHFVSWGEKIKIVDWSLQYDVLIVLLINIPFLLLLIIFKKVAAVFLRWFIVPLFVIINSIMLLLNLMDIFYFRFHFQRANADLLFVLDHPFKEFFHLSIVVIIGILLLVLLTFLISWKIHQRLFRSFLSLQTVRPIIIFCVCILCVAFICKNVVGKLLLPTSALTSLSSQEMTMAQNSFHTFSYSLFRNGQEISLKNYFSNTECDSLFPITKKVSTSSDTGKKNIVLFIMESVPYNFFDSSSPYKVALPFFDSLLQHSTFFNNAFSFGLHSNQGIISILSGTPTLTEIPLYHSQFVNMPVTKVGTALKSTGYHSFFCIGDDYDNFGFAKCVNWLGIQKYYCRDDMTAYKGKPSHTMGLHDEYVLDFFHNKINEQTAPFFAVNYNISTHYPYDLPPDFKQQLPSNYSTAMKSMSYYDHSLQDFFSAAAKEKWFSNTIFIFCSDHWMVPTEINPKFENVNSYRIPIIVYTPTVNKKIVNNVLVSQFDILGTILSIGGYKENINSYGSNLLDSVTTSNNKYIFTKKLNSTFECIGNDHVLGYDPITEKPEYFYNYKQDPTLSKNLLNIDPAQQESIIMMKAFLQKASMEYLHQSFK